MTTSCSCGQPLVLAIGSDLVVTVSGVEVRFRRHTDHVVCPACMFSYRVDELRPARA